MVTLGKEKCYSKRKACVWGKEEANKLQAKADVKEAAEIAHEDAIGQKTKEQAL